MSGPHPIQAGLSGVMAAPLQPVSPTGSAGSSGSTTHAGTGAGSTPPPGGFTPDGGPVPPAIYIDTINWFTDCNCGPTVGELLSSTNGPSEKSGPDSSSGGGGGTSAGSGVSVSLKSGPMDSDANLITGEFLQDHQLATYQSQGVLNGIDLQYSSLDADPYPIVTAYFTAMDPNSSSITSITASLTVNGVSQGTAVTYNDVSLTEGAGYIVQVQAVDVSTYATGLYSDSLTITKYFSGGGSTNHTYST
jgi:hypothetical protein